MRQEEPYTPCDVFQVPQSHPHWSARPTCEEMNQVNELFGLFDRKHLNGVVVACKFTFRRIQPCKERAHPAYDYRGENDDTWEKAKKLMEQAVLDRIADLFSGDTPHILPDQMKAFNVLRQPPQVRETCIVVWCTVHDDSS